MVELFFAVLYRYELKYSRTSVIPNQKAEFEFSQSPLIFKREIASCRTFLTYEEALYLREQGICARVGTGDVLVFGQDGKPIDNQLRFPNECARHKILDMIGDFSLMPFDLVGEISATKTGHQQNANVVRYILDSLDLRF